MAAELVERVALTPMMPGRDTEFAEMLDEYRAAGETHVYTGLFVKAWEGYSAFYDLLARMRAGSFPTPDIVPMDSYFIEADGQILGEIYLRHRLSSRLQKIGGHVGYKVRPSCRNRGVATAALQLALDQLAALGVEQALVTCHETNATSARVIEKCGGARIDDSFVDEHVERRYLVPTKKDRKPTEAYAEL